MEPDPEPARAVREGKAAPAAQGRSLTRSVQDFVAVQSDLARDGLQQVIDTNRRVAEVSLRIANEAGQIIQAQADKNAKQVRRVA
jgi:phasin family protein